LIHFYKRCLSDDRMPKVYIGGLPLDCDQDTIINLLEERQIDGHQSVEIKRGGYAFVQFREERQAVNAVTELNGSSAQN